MAREWSGAFWHSLLKDGVGATRSRSTARPSKALWIIHNRQFYIIYYSNKQGAITPVNMCIWLRIASKYCAQNRHPSCVNAFRAFQRGQVFPLKSTTNYASPTFKYTRVMLSIPVIIGIYPSCNRSFRTEVHDPVQRVIRRPNPSG